MKGRDRQGENTGTPNPYAGDDFESRVNRWLLGVNETPVEVVVDALEKRRARDIVLNHNLRTVSDFDAVDFYFPISILLVVFILRYMLLRSFFGEPGAAFVIVLLQGYLLYDLLSRIRRRPSGRMIAGLAMPHESMDWLRSIFIYLLSLPVAIAAGMLTHQVFPQITSYISAIFSFKALFAAGYMLVSGVILTALTEELWFRGIGLAGFMRNGGSPLRAAIVTSLVFGALHGADRFLFTAILGVAISVIRLRTGSLYCCMAVHALHNFSVLAIAFAAGGVRAFTFA